MIVYISLSSPAEHYVHSCRTKELVQSLQFRSYNQLFGTVSDARVSAYVPVAVSYLPEACLPLVAAGSCSHIHGLFSLSTSSSAKTHNTVLVANSPPETD